jgi:hypothetical protein
MLNPNVGDGDLNDALLESRNPSLRRSAESLIYRTGIHSQKGRPD